MSRIEIWRAGHCTWNGPIATWVNEGEDFLGWKVEAVGSTSTKLQQQDRTIELELYPQR